MRSLRRLLHQLFGIFHKDAVDPRISEELASHIEIAVADKMRRGMIEADARREAQLELHSASTKERYREQEGVPALEHFGQDVRYALRAFRKDPSFAITATLVLALGFTAATSIYAFVDAALIKPLPYSDPNRLLFVTGSVKGIRLANLSYLDYLDFKQQTTTLSSLDVHRGNGYLVNTDHGVEMARGVDTSAGFFRTLGVRPILGRDFVDGEDAPEAAKVVILSYESWQKRFGGKDDVIGQTLKLDGIPHTIIGVLPTNFDFAMRGRAEFWTALQVTAKEECLKRRSCHNLYGVGRLKDGATEAAARADLNVIAKRLEQQYPDSNRERTMTVISLAEQVIGQQRPILLVMLGGSFLLLLIACVNVASLLLVRSEGRKREIAVRVALGASPRRLLRQFVAEGIVLVGTAAALAVVATNAATKFLVSLVPQDIARTMPFLRDVGLSAHVLIVLAILFVVAIAVFSAVPLARIRLADMQEGLKQDGHASQGKTWKRFAGNLVVAELAITMMLLVAAGLLSQSLYRLLRVDLGFDPSNVVTVGTLTLPDADYPKPEQIVTARRQIIDAVRSVPGVESVALVSQLPVSGNGNTNWIRIVGHEWHGEHNETNAREASDTYFPTLRAHIKSGRNFTQAEEAAQMKVAVVNQAFVDTYMAKGEDPIGKKIELVSIRPIVQYEIVGVVENVREATLDQDTAATFYYPSPDQYPSLLVRTNSGLNPTAVVQSVNRAIHQVNPNIATYDFQTLAERISNSEPAYVRRASAVLVGGFSVTALVLSVIGLYGVIAYSVGRRTREIGIRMALGARRELIYRLIFTEAGWLIGSGVIAGVVGALLTTTVMRSLLFGVGAWDPRTFTSVVALLAVAALAASYFPARRAASVDPMNVLRTE
jgi:predicted permease